MEIIFERCPTCDTHACAFAVIDGVTHCPMCAPVPDKEPHDYKPVEIGGVVKLSAKQALSIMSHACVLPNLVSGVCCGDTGDCGHECGIG